MKKIPKFLFVDLLKFRNALFLISLLSLSFYVTSCKKKYSGPKYESDLFQMIDDYSTAYGKKDNFEVVLVGDFTHPTEYVMFGVWLRSCISEDLHEGKVRATKFVRDFYDMIQQNQLAKVYFDQTRDYYVKNKAEKIDIKTIGVKIAYWDKSVNRPQAPYLAQITFLSGNFYYYEADPVTQALRLVYQESYDDALKNIQKTDVLQSQLQK